MSFICCTMSPECLSNDFPPAVLNNFDYVFAENGLVAYKAGEVIEIQSLKAHLGEDKLKSLINFILHYIAGGWGLGDDQQQTPTIELLSHTDMLSCCCKCPSPADQSCTLQIASHCGPSLFPN